MTFGTNWNIPRGKKVRKKFVHNLVPRSYRLIVTELQTLGRSGYMPSLYKPTVSRIITFCIHHPVYHTSGIPYLKLFHSFSDFVVCVVTTLVFPQNLSASFSINVAILYLSFKRAIAASNKLINRQHYKRHTQKIPVVFHSLSHFTLTATQLNLSFLKTLNYHKMIQRLVLSFRILHLFHLNATKTSATLWFISVHFKPNTNLELSNALAHDAKLLVLSFITQRKCRDPRDPSRSLITKKKKVVHW